MDDTTAHMSVIEARALAVRAHADQRDRDDSFHIQHVARVADAVSRADDHQRVAWLHDVLEDSDVEPAELQRRLPAAEFDALVLLTRQSEHTYESYVARIAGATGEAGALARAVKEADALDNLRRSMLARDPAVARYGGALAQLWGAERVRS